MSAPKGSSGARPTLAELRDVNERLLMAALRAQELAAALQVEQATLETERARLAVILAEMGDAVLVTSATGALLHTNAAYARIAGGAARPLAPQDAQGRALRDAPGAGGARRKIQPGVHAEGRGRESALVRSQRRAAARPRGRTRRRGHPRHHRVERPAPPPG